LSLLLRRRGPAVYGDPSHPSQRRGLAEIPRGTCWCWSPDVRERCTMSEASSVASCSYRTQGPCPSVRRRFVPPARRIFQRGLFAVRCIPIPWGMLVPPCVANRRRRAARWGEIRSSNKVRPWRECARKQRPCCSRRAPVQRPKFKTCLSLTPKRLGEILRSLSGWLSRQASGLSPESSDASRKLTIRSSSSSLESCNRRLLTAGIGINSSYC
jgi:hypothetical protein